MSERRLQVHFNTEHNDMFLNVETADFRDTMKVHCEDRWKTVAADLLRTNDRNVAVGKMADTLLALALEQPVPQHSLVATLYGYAVQRVDFYAVALGLIIEAEAADPSLVKAVADDEIEESEERSLAQL